MTATLVELRSRMSEIESAVGRSESVMILRRNRPWAVLVPVQSHRQTQTDATPVRSRDFTACGMWADRADVRDPTTWVKALRKDRTVR